MCVRNIGFYSVSTIFQLDVGTIPTVWYYFLFILFTNGCSYSRYSPLRHPCGI